MGQTIKYQVGPDVAIKWGQAGLAKSPLNKDTYLQIIRQFHLAFKGKDKDGAEIYDVLIEQLLRAIRKYDPDYKLKLKQIVEMIDAKFC